MSKKFNHFVANLTQTNLYLVGKAYKIIGARIDSNRREEKMELNGRTYNVNIVYSLDEFGAGGKLVPIGY